MSISNLKLQLLLTLCVCGIAGGYPGEDADLTYVPSLPGELQAKSCRAFLFLNPNPGSLLGTWISKDARETMM